GPSDAPPDELVYAPFSDYSCYVTIANKSDEELERGPTTADDGYYVSYPPATIPAGGTAELWIQDLPRIEGSRGGTAYTPAAARRYSTTPPPGARRSSRPRRARRPRRSPPTPSLPEGTPSSSTSRSTRAARTVSSPGLPAACWRSRSRRPGSSTTRARTSSI